MLLLLFLQALLGEGAEAGDEEDGEEEEEEINLHAAASDGALQWYSVSGFFQHPAAVGRWACSGPAKFAAALWMQLGSTVAGFVVSKAGQQQKLATRVGTKHRGKLLPSSTASSRPVERRLLTDRQAACCLAVCCPLHLVLLLRRQCRAVAAAAGRGGV